MLLVIDNYDSFTYNLVQFFGELGADMEVRRNDEVTVEEIKDLNPQRICISPGPCSPNEAGISCEVISQFWSGGSHPRCMSRTSIDRAGVWGRGRPGGAVDAWENFDDRAQRRGCFSRVGFSPRGNPVSFLDPS